jgi:hypothetical protein
MEIIELNSVWCMRNNELGILGSHSGEYEDD